MKELLALKKSENLKTDFSRDIEAELQLNIMTIVTLPRLWNPEVMKELNSGVRLFNEKIRYLKIDLIEHFW